MTTKFVAVKFTISDLVAEAAEMARAECCLRDRFYEVLRERVATLPTDAKSWQQQKIRDELSEELALEATQRELQELVARVVEETHALHRGVLAQAQAGEFGDGRLFVVDGRKGLYFARLVALEENACRQARFGDLLIDEKWIYTEERIARINFSHIRNGVLRTGLFLEVSRHVSDSEVEETCAELLRQGFSLHRLFALTHATGVSLVIQAGQRFIMGSCSHHSGRVEAIGVALPTGRFAVFTDFAGDKTGWKEEGARLHGVTDDALWAPNLSAKWGGGLENREELSAPTEEEIAFLRGQEGEPSIPERNALTPPPVRLPGRT